MYTFIFTVSMLLSTTLSLTSCVSSPLSAYNYQVVANGTLTGQKLQQRLAAESDVEADKIIVSISDEVVERRIFGVDDSGQPNRFLQELQVQLSVSKNGKVIAKDSIFSSAEIDNDSFQLGQFKQLMSSDLATHAYQRVQQILQTTN